ncbi:YgaP family membrane protein [Pontibacter ummariensis]|uniref:YgaP family membrane protein n=1 Tax=Pontibacter ummariensis TaxID=1610492 RepID=UPI000B7887F4
MEKFFRFIGSHNGRTVRVAAGLALIGAGTMRKGKPYWPLMAAGLVPLSAGLLDKCVLGPLAGKPFSGERLREQMSRQKV